MTSFSVLEKKKREEGRKKKWRETRVKLAQLSRQENGGSECYVTGWRRNSAMRADLCAFFFNVKCVLKLSGSFDACVKPECTQQPSRRCVAKIQLCAHVTSDQREI